MIIKLALVMTELVETSKGNVVEKKRLRKTMKYGGSRHVQQLVEYIESNCRDIDSTHAHIHSQIKKKNSTLVNLKAEFNQFDCIKKTQIAVHKVVHGDSEGAKKKLDENLIPINLILTNKFLEIEKVQQEIIALEKQLITINAVSERIQKQKVELLEYDVNKKLVISDVVYFP